MATRREQIEQACERATEEADQLLRDAAEDYRVTFLIPFCEKHGLTFFSGMGSYGFTLPDGENVNPVYTTMERLDEFEGLRAVFEELEISLGERFELGQWVSDVKKEDYEAIS